MLISPVTAVNRVTNKYMCVKRLVAMILMLQDRIEGEKAGRLLYALQIASANMARVKEETPRPAQVVVDVERVGKTPIGMTPWSEKPEGHEPEEVEDRIVARTKRAIREEEENERRAEENEQMSTQLEQITEKMEEYGEEMEKIIARDDPTVEGLKQEILRAKNRMEWVADANLHGTTLSRADDLSEERREEWKKLREKRNSETHRLVRKLMKRNQG